MIVTSEARELSSKKVERDLKRAIESIDEQVRGIALSGRTKLVIYPISAPALSGLSSSALQSLKDHLMGCGYTVYDSKHGPECPDHLRIKWEISW